MVVGAELRPDGNVKRGGRATPLDGIVFCSGGGGVIVWGVVSCCMTGDELSIFGVR